MKYAQWQTGAPAPEAAAALTAAGIPALLAQILASRGVTTPEGAAALLGGAQTPLNDPLAMAGMPAARDRVREALRRGERICVFGDYDVDGITSTCLLTEYLRGRGGNVRSYIPDRLEEGYGLSVRALETLAEDGVQLVVTVDCGVTAVDEAAACRALGMDLVVTDHHACAGALPEAAAVVDPHRPDDSYPFKGLAGVGVAFKLAAAVEGEQDALLDRFADLLALGTVADVMPLLDENRAMTARGLAALRSRPRPGIRALLEASGWGSGNLNATSISYLLAPRLNAAGRMGQVDVALRLMLSRDGAEAASLAEGLCELNRQRQSVEQAIYAAARRELSGQSPAAIVLASDSWHPGVAGIVASRLGEEYGCPACLICLDGETGKASCRSYGGFPLMDALTRLSPLLERYGGHQQAAGFTIRAENIPAFRDALSEMAARQQAAAPSVPTLSLDCCVDDPALLSLEQVEALERLEPCGTGCPRPQICVSGLEVLSATEVGGGKHLRLRMRLGGRTVDGIFFSTTAQKAGVAAGDVIDAAAVPQVNEFRGMRSTQLQLLDLRLTEGQRAVRDAELGLYRRQQAGEALSAAEAAALLPPRAEFAALWRYLRERSVQGILREEPDCLCRQVARRAGLEVSFARTRVCLDVLGECGLLRCTQRQELLEIRLTQPERRVDLDASAILRALRQMAQKP